MAHPAATKDFEDYDVPGVGIVSGTAVISVHGYITHNDWWISSLSNVLRYSDDDGDLHPFVPSEAEAAAIINHLQADRFFLSDCVEALEDAGYDMKDAA